MSMLQVLSYALSEEQSDEHLQAVSDAITASAADKSPVSTQQHQAEDPTACTSQHAVGSREAAARAALADTSTEATSMQGPHHSKAVGDAESKAPTHERASTEPAEVLSSEQHQLRKEGTAHEKARDKPDERAVFQPVHAESFSAG